MTRASDSLTITRECPHCRQTVTLPSLLVLKAAVYGPMTGPCPKCGEPLTVEPRS